MDINNPQLGDTKIDDGGTWIYSDDFSHNQKYPKVSPRWLLVSKYREQDFVYSTTPFNPNSTNYPQKSFSSNAKQDSTSSLIIVFFIVAGAIILKKYR